MMEEDPPTFLVIGAMKAGTTSLHRYLASHPEIFMSRPKELNFFSDSENWRRGTQWYQQHFGKASRRALAAGESSTNYSKHPEYPGVPERIASILPDVRLIYVLRHPIERLVSHYQHRVARRRERESIEVALTNNPIYANASRYAMQIERYLDHFDREQLLLVQSSDLRGYRAGTMSRIYRFLGVDDSFLPPEIGSEFYRTADQGSYTLLGTAVRQVPGIRRLGALMPKPMRRNLRPLVKRNVGAYRPALSVELRRKLEDDIRDDVTRLRAYMPEGFDGWGIG